MVAMSCSQLLSTIADSNSSPVDFPADMTDLAHAFPFLRRQPHINSETFRTHQVVPQKSATTGKDRIAPAILAQKDPFPLEFNTSHPPPGTPDSKCSLEEPLYWRMPFVSI